jgi:hypothetical protein
VSDMVDRYVTHGDRIDLEGLLFALGVEKDDGGAFALEDARPLSWVRKEIVGGASSAMANLAGTSEGRGTSEP